MGARLEADSMVVRRGGDPEKMRAVRERGSLQLAGDI